MSQLSLFPTASEDPVPGRLQRGLSLLRCARYDMDAVQDAVRKHGLLEDALGLVPRGCIPQPGSTLEDCEDYLLFQLRHLESEIYYLTQKTGR